MRAARALGAGLATACLLAACAGLTPIEPEAGFELDPDEGVLVIDTDTGLSNLTIRFSPVPLGPGDRVDIPEGSSRLFCKLAAGTYRWSSVTARPFMWRLVSDDSLRFRIEPGVINYLGNLYIDPWAQQFRFIDRSGEFVAELDEELPGLLSRYPIRYGGAMRDDFLEIYSGARRAAPPAANAISGFRRSGLSGCDEPLFRPFELQRAVLSPDGNFVVAQMQDRKGPHIRLIEVESGLATEILQVRDRPDVEITQLFWGDRDSVVFTLDKKRDLWGRGQATESRAYVVDVGREGDHLTHFNHVVETRGWVVDPLPDRDDEILFQPSNDKSSVYRVRLSQLAEYRKGEQVRAEGGPLDQGQFAESARVAHLDEPVLWWFTDGGGRVRAALTTPGDASARFWYRETVDSRWKEVLSFPPDKIPDVLPLGFTADGKRLLVASDRDRDRYALFEFDPEEGELGKLVYAHPSAQVEGVVYDFAGTRPMGAVYLDQGVPRFHYFEAGDQRERALLEQAFPERAVRPMSTSADGRKVLVLAASASDPGAYYRVDLDTRDIREVGKVAPWLDPQALAQVTALRVKSGDGTEFDAFLAAPPGVARPPIVVLPHGGPIGVMDGREFSREVQFLAERGMAVLQVNYRGSEGYGKSFLEAGKREWGRGIEDDIDAALAQVIARGAVDEQRMCLAGGSYGGYSALIGVLRHPDRFRCAASFAGVTDIPLMFASSDWSVSPVARKTMAEVVGDPATEYETLKGLSPVYQLDRLRVPVFIAQGSHDVRVHPDHAYRMKAMLELGGKEFEWLMVEDMGHGFDSLEQECAYFKRLRNFLTRKLELPPN